MNTQKHLYLVEVQRAIFQQLLTYETLLKEGYFLHIYRYHDGAMKVFLGKKEVWSCIGRFDFDTLPITTAKDVDEAMKKNAHRACYAYTPNNYAEMEYRGTLTDTYRK